MSDNLIIKQICSSTGSGESSEVKLIVDTKTVNFDVDENVPQVAVR